MKTIHIADEYYVCITTTNFIAAKLSTASKNLLFKKPTYHATFESALENILKRMEKDALTNPENDVYELCDAIEQIKKIRQESSLLVQNATDTHNSLYISESQIEDNGDENDDEEIKGQIETDSKEGVQ